MHNLADCYSYSLLLSFGGYATYLLAFFFGFWNPIKGVWRAILIIVLSIVVGIIFSILTVNIDLQCWWYSKDHDIFSETIFMSSFMILKLLLCVYVGVGIRYVIRKGK